MAPKLDAKGRTNPQATRLRNDQQRVGLRAVEFAQGLDHLGKGRASVQEVVSFFPVGKVPAKVDLMFGISGKARWQSQA